MKPGRALAPLLLGACVPVIGVLFFLMQSLRTFPGPLRDLLVQVGMAMLYLSLFAVAGGRCAAREDARWNRFLFLLVPALALLAEPMLISKVPPAVDFLLVGVNAPFFAFWDRVYDLVAPCSIVATALPTLLCFLAFSLGEWVQRTHRTRGAKRLAALFCAGLAALCLFPTSNPADEMKPLRDRYSACEAEAGLVPDDQISAASSRKKAGTVCVMRIYSDPGTMPSRSGGFQVDVGHTFLTFFNASAAPITVGRHSVAPGTAISVGKFGRFSDVSGNHYKGLFYNVEAQRAAINHWYGPDRSIYYELTAPELETVTNTLLRQENGYLIAGNNCSVAAAKIWNSVLRPSDDRYLTTYGTPALVYHEIAETGYSVEGNRLISADYPRCYYYHGTLWEFADPQVRE